MDGVEGYVVDPQAVGERPSRRSAVPPSLDPNGSRHDDFYGGCPVLALCDDLSLSHNPAVLGMRRIFEGLDRLVVQQHHLAHAAGSVRASAQSTTSSGLASGCRSTISVAA